MATSISEAIALVQRVDSVEQSLEARQLLRILPDECIDAVTRLFVRQQCAQCRATYRDWESVGRWRCAMHAMRFCPERRVFPCCSARTPHARGCIPCDHTPGEPWQVDSYQHIPALVAQHVQQNIPREARLYDPHTGDYYIQRLDPDVAAQQLFRAETMP